MEIWHISAVWAAMSGAAACSAGSWLSSTISSVSSITCRSSSSSAELSFTVISSVSSGMFSSTMDSSGASVSFSVSTTASVTISVISSAMAGTVDVRVIAAASATDTLLFNSVFLCILHVSFQKCFGHQYWLYQQMIFKLSFLICQISVW